MEDVYKRQMLGDEIVEGGEEAAVDSVGPDDEGRGGSGDVLTGDVDGDVAGVGRGMAGGDVELGGIGGVGRAEGAGVAGDAGIELAVGGAHGEFNDRDVYKRQLLVLTERVEFPPKGCSSWPNIRCCRLGSLRG